MHRLLPPASSHTQTSPAASLSSALGSTHIQLCSDKNEEKYINYTNQRLNGQQPTKKCTNQVSHPDEEQGAVLTIIITSCTSPRNAGSITSHTSDLQAPCSATQHPESATAVLCRQQRVCSTQCMEPLFKAACTAESASAFASLH